jgi:hypothetical protein
MVVPELLSPQIADNYIVALFHRTMNLQPENLLDGSTERFPEAIFKNYLAPASRDAPALKPK